MNQNLSRKQSILLGLVVLLIVGLAGLGLFSLANKQGYWSETTELTVGFAEVHDIFPGTPVRLRGLEVGQVVGLDYPDLEGPEAVVNVRLKVHKQYAQRLNADATAQIQSTGLLGGKIVALMPGSSKTGPLNGHRLLTGKADSLSDATAKLTEVADETKQLVQAVRNGQGTVGKLLTDDKLYNDLRSLATDSRAMVQRAEGAVTKVEGQVGNVERFVQDGRETMRSAKTTVDGVNQSWLGRKFVEDATAILVRPRHRKEAVTYDVADLFEPNSAILTARGQAHLLNVAGWLKNNHPSSAEVVLVALCDPNNRSQTSSSALELTRMQTEVALEFLKAQKVHKISWVSSRKMTTLGLGFGPSPVVDSEPLPPSYLQVMLFTPS